MEHSTAYGELKAQYKRQSHTVHTKESVTDSITLWEHKLLEKQRDYYIPYVAEVFVKEKMN